MAQIDFNVSEVTPTQEYSPLPEGRYEAVVTDSSLRENRNGSGNYILLEFEVVSGEYRGRKLWSRYNVRHTNPAAVEIGRSQFAAVCRAVGLVNPRDTAELHNRTLVLMVKCRKRKDSDELENAIAGYRAKESAPASSANTQTQATSAPWAR